MEVQLSLGLLHFSSDGLLSLATRWLYFAWIRAGFSLTVRLCTAGVMYVCSLRTECFPFSVRTASFGVEKHGILKMRKSNKTPMNLLLALGKVHITKMQIFQMGSPSFLDGVFYHLRGAQKKMSPSAHFVVFGLLLLHTTIPEKKVHVDTNPMLKTHGNQVAQNARGPELAGRPVIPPSFDFMGHSKKPVSPTTLSISLFLVLDVWGLFWFSLISEVDVRALKLPLESRNGFPRAVSTYECTGYFVRACNFCDLRWSLIEENFCLRIVSAEFHHFYLCFCRHGVKQNNRKAASLIEFQSSVLCDLQVKNVHCVKIWSC